MANMTPIEPDIKDIWERTYRNLDMRQFIKGTKEAQKKTLKKLLNDSVGTFRDKKKNVATQTLIDKKFYDLAIEKNAVRKQLIAEAQKNYLETKEERFSDIETKMIEFKSGKQKGYRFFQYSGIDKSTGKRQHAGRLLYARSEKESPFEYAEHRPPTALTHARPPMRKSDLK